MQRILARYEAAGGGLIANGLAYAALFAIVPAVLLVAGVAGIVIADPIERASVVGTIAGVLPPVRDLATTVLGEATQNAAPVSALGLVALLWGASRFAVAFQDAIGRVAGGSRRRGLLWENLGALLAVLLLVGVILASTVVAGLGAFLDAGQAAGLVAIVSQGVALAIGYLPLVGAVVAVAIVYRVVPVTPPRWTSIAPAALVVGLVVSAFTLLFVFIAPRLIGAAALLGTLASLFAALAWLSLTFQALLLGMAWTADRDAGRGSVGLGGPAATAEAGGRG